MPATLIRHRHITAIVGSIVTVDISGLPYCPELNPRFGDLAIIEDARRLHVLAQVIEIDGSQVRLQVFSGTRGVSTSASIRFLGRPMRACYSANILGRIFSGSGKPMDGGPDLGLEDKIAIDGPTVNPLQRDLASKLIRTDIPMIDVFNCLVESQKIPIFSVPGEPYNSLLARIGIQADADVVVFAGMGLIFDDFHFFRSRFEQAGVKARTVMYCNMASDPVVERLLVPDLALAVAERLAVTENKRVLVLMTDMSAFADALKEVGVSMEHVPSNRGYPGDLYSQLARRYEKACDYKGAGSVTILSVTTLPGNDVTHPIPDNTGYITEGQLYLHGGMIDPFGSLSRLKQHVIGRATREDHAQIMNAMIRFYAGAVDAEQKQIMAFELSAYDRQLLKFGKLFRERFMNIAVSMPLEQALDCCWQTLAACFAADQLLIKQELIDHYFPRHVQASV